MNLTCESCGGKNSLPKGKTEMFCAFCGNHIVVAAKPISKDKTKTINSGSDKERILEYIRGGSKGTLDLPLADLKGIQLKNVNLQGANLSGANLKKADLSGANLADANLSGADLSKSKLNGVSFIKANLIKTIFYESEMDGVDFSEANLKDASLENCGLSKANFNNANLTNTSLASYSDLRGADLGKAIFSNTNFNNAFLDEIDFRTWPINIFKTLIEDEKGNNIYMRYSNLSMMNLKGFDLSGFDLGNANLKGVNLSNSKLEFTHLIEADLSNANLTGADLNNAYLTKANLRGANLTGANLNWADLTDSNWDNTTNFKGANLKNAKGIKSNGCYLTSACTEAMQLPDNCYELQTLRKFRDDYVAQTTDGRSMIEEYYETAPEIVDAINATGNGNEIFKGLYAEINEIVSLIENGKSEEAVLAYRILTQSLKNKYLN